MAVPQLFLVRNSAIGLAVRNIAELRRCGLKLRMPIFGYYYSTCRSYPDYHKYFDCPRHSNYPNCPRYPILPNYSNHLSFHFRPKYPNIN
jgi:hypothetical protein